MEGAVTTDEISNEKQDELNTGSKESEVEETIGETMLVPENESADQDTKNESIPEEIQSSPVDETLVNRKRSLRLPEMRGRKRSLSCPAPRNPKKIHRVNKVDTHCWICHEVGRDVICQTCPRVYHLDCLGGSQFDRLCPECQVQSLLGGDVEPFELGKLELKQLLLFAFQAAVVDTKSKSLMSDNKFCKYFQSSAESICSMVCEVIDLSILLDKINDDMMNPYNTTAKFFSDIKWIYHNSYILHGADSDITDTAMQLEKNFKRELQDLEACPECYYVKHCQHYENFFTLVCKKPHDIVWAKLRGCPFWPAKCLRINNGQVDVRFFGTHDKSIIHMNQCYRISELSPNATEKKQKKYLAAMEELGVYIRNYEKQLQRKFFYFKNKTPLTEDPSVQNPKENDQDFLNISSYTDGYKSYALKSLVVLCDRLSPSEIPTNEDQDAAKAHDLTELISMSKDFSTDKDKEQSDESLLSLDDVQSQATDAAGYDSAPPIAMIADSTSSETMDHSDVIFCNNQDSSTVDSLPTEEVSVNVQKHSREVQIYQDNNTAISVPSVVASQSPEGSCFKIPAMDSTSSEADDGVVILSVHRPSIDLPLSLSKKVSDGDAISIFKELMSTEKSVAQILEKPLLSAALCQSLYNKHDNLLQKFLKQTLIFGLESMRSSWLSMKAQDRVEDSQDVTKFTEACEKTYKMCSHLMMEKDALLRKCKLMEANIKKLESSLEKCQDELTHVKNQKLNADTVVKIMFHKTFPIDNDIINRNPVAIENLAARIHIQMERLQALNSQMARQESALRAKEEKIVRQSQLLLAKNIQIEKQQKSLEEKDVELKNQQDTIKDLRIKLADFEDLKLLEHGELIEDSARKIWDQRIFTTRMLTELNKKANALNEKDMAIKAQRQLLDKKHRKRESSMKELIQYQALLHSKDVILNKLKDTIYWIMGEYLSNLERPETQDVGCQTVWHAPPEKTVVQDNSFEDERRDWQKTQPTDSNVMCLPQDTSQHMLSLSTTNIQQQRAFRIHIRDGVPVHVEAHIDQVQSNQTRALPVVPNVPAYPTSNFNCALPSFQTIRNYNGTPPFSSDASHNVRATFYPTIYGAVNYQNVLTNHLATSSNPATQTYSHQLNMPTGLGMPARLGVPTGYGLPPGFGASLQGGGVPANATAACGATRYGATRKRAKKNTKY